LSDRRTFLADGPVTAVALFSASQPEREAACSPQEARELLAGLCREAGQGDRSVLVEIHGLVFGHAGLAVAGMSTQFFAARVLGAAGDGRLLLVPGWYWVPGYAADGAAEGRAEAIGRWWTWWQQEGERLPWNYQSDAATFGQTPEQPPPNQRSGRLGGIAYAGSV
jgi:hypothetical protein